MAHVLKSDLVTHHRLVCLHQMGKRTALGQWLFVCWKNADGLSVALTFDLCPWKA